jgi:hypothetical protein
MHSIALRDDSRRNPNGVRAHPINLPAGNAALPSRLPGAPVTGKGPRTATLIPLTSMTTSTSSFANRDLVDAQRQKRERLRDAPQARSNWAD